MFYILKTYILIIPQKFNLSSWVYKKPREMGLSESERVKGIEPSSSAWKANIITIIRHPLI